jgi:hypothetical protein
MAGVSIAGTCCRTMTASILHWFIELLILWHMLPLDRLQLNWVAGPHAHKEAWCEIDVLGQVAANDLPKCLMVLQNIDRLDLAQWFIDAANHEQSKLMPPELVPR